jgi:hypothetical protein
MRERNIAADVIKLFTRLAVYPPGIRLAVNLKVLIGLLIHNPNMQNVLIDGLTEHERVALTTLDATGLPVRMREVAHGLINVHERWLLMKQLRPAFIQAWNSVEERLVLTKEDDVGNPDVGVSGD